MKNKNIINNNNEDEIAAEYDFSNGVRGKHHEKMSEGYTVSVFSPNNNTNEQQVIEKIRYFKIDKDVNKVFKTSDEVNNALRAFINAIPKTRRRAARTV